ncbi:hypothetical protein BC332_14474 [Capsicum chinense]|nr:hypothetical protein BC332_14474 [Capsicum chinense]
MSLRLGALHPCPCGWVLYIHVLAAGCSTSMSLRLGALHPCPCGWVLYIHVLAAGCSTSMSLRLGALHPCPCGWVLYIHVLAAGCSTSMSLRLGALHPCPCGWVLYIHVLVATKKGTRNKVRDVLAATKKGTRLGSGARGTQVRTSRASGLGLKEGPGSEGPVDLTGQWLADESADLIGQRGRNILSQQ